MTLTLTPTPTSTPAGRPAGSPTVRATQVLDALRSDADPTRPPSAARSLAAAVLTFGVWPAVRWNVRFRDVIARDRRAFDRLADWSRHRLPETQARGLAGAAGRVRQRDAATLVVALLGSLAGLAVFWTVEGSAGPAGVWQALIGSTFGFRRVWAWHPSGPVAGAFVAWTVGLSAAYATHLVQVHLHARAVRRFLDEFNRTVAVEEGYPPVLLEPFGLGFAPAWVLAAGALLFLNAAWAIPFAAAGATDARYQRRASVRVRQDLAARVRNVIFDNPELGRPAARWPVDAARCVTPGCGAAVGPRAKFCRRCGARRGRSVDLAA